MRKEKKIEDWVQDLQREIDRQEEADYSKKVIEEYRNPSNFGVIEDADAQGEITGPCGDTMKISLKIRDGVVTKACFWTDGCGPTIACGSMLTKLILGKTIEESKRLSQKELLQVLGGLPKEHEHCSILATDALKAALNNYQKTD